MSLRSPAAAAGAMAVPYRAAALSAQGDAHGWRDTIDHAPGADDDVVNAAAGALLAVAAVSVAALGRAGAGNSLRAVLPDPAALRGGW